MNKYLGILLAFILLFGFSTTKALAYSDSWDTHGNDACVSFTVNQPVGTWPAFSFRQDDTVFTYVALAGGADRWDVHEQPIEPTFLGNFSGNFVGPGQKICKDGQYIKYYQNNNLVGTVGPLRFGLTVNQVEVNSDDGVFTNVSVETLASSAVTIDASPATSNVAVGTPFTVDVKVNDDNNAFNAAQATVSLSSNLSITGIHYPTTNSCNLDFTQRPTTSDPSFAGAVFGGSKTTCTVYTLTLTPTAAGTGTVTFTNGSVKAYSDNSEILTGVQNASYTISAASATPTPTPPLSQLAVTSPLLTYSTSYTLAGTKDNTITHVFVNDSDSGSTYPTSTTWQAPQTLSLGANNFTIYGRDDSGNQTATQNVTVNRHTLGDINGDGAVDLIDASLFAVDWDKTGHLTYILSDMNGDGSADLTDLSILAKLE